MYSKLYTCRVRVCVLFVCSLSDQLRAVSAERDEVRRNLQRAQLSIETLHDTHEKAM